MTYLVFMSDDNALDRTVFYNYPSEKNTKFDSLAAGINAAGHMVTSIITVTQMTTDTMYSTLISVKLSPKMLKMINGTTIIRKKLP